MTCTSQDEVQLHPPSVNNGMNHTAVAFSILWTQYKESENLLLRSLCAELASR